MPGSERRSRPAPPITSTTNERVKAIRALHDPTKRRAQRRFFVEGIRLLEAALAAGRHPELALVDEDRLLVTPRGRALLGSLDPDRVLFVGEKVLLSVVDTLAPQGVVAVFAYDPEPAQPSPDVHLLVLDGLQDPGNVGTALRSAEAAGFGAVLLVPRSTDVYAPKVVRAGAGAHFTLALYPECDWPRVRALSGDRRLVVATAQAPRAYFELDWTVPTTLVVGSEAHGPSPTALEQADERVSIPMVGRAESLNAGVAASIIVFEALRQRLAVS
ncbi:MAG: RNA methyltransferase [Chloroflexi bacterium]|nr:RNA methyltransferase [Chloroflexota bacterium]